MIYNYEFTELAINDIDYVVLAFCLFYFINWTILHIIILKKGLENYIIYTRKIQWDCRKLGGLHEIYK